MPVFPHGRLVRNNVDDKWTTHLLSKHFYSEKVYDDSSSDQPKLRWRHRNFFADNGAPQRSHVSDSSDDKTDSEKTDTEKMDVELKQVSVRIPD
ncbi:unnamed protein product [Ilex paraguariensis]|uniref:Uncharacterized protein n=1 Tax=Ilex paraguariensis TaxID=185542 RepID=A0ABC8SU44_9AQUA